MVARKTRFVGQVIRRSPYHEIRWKPGSVFPYFWGCSGALRWLSEISRIGPPNLYRFLALVHFLRKTHLVHLGIVVPSTHRCLYCRKRIGLLRRLQDQQFCSAEHRRKLTSGSARAIRDAEDLYGVEEIHGPTWGTITALKRDEKEERKGGLGTTIFVAMGVVVLMAGLAQMPQGTPPPKAVSALPKNSANRSSGGIFQSLGNLAQSTTSTNLHDDFRAGLNNWEGRTADWTAEAGQVRPAGLRIWKPSASLTNYQMEFMGQIEQPVDREFSGFLQNNDRSRRTIPDGRGEIAPPCHWHHCDAPVPGPGSQRHKSYPTSRVPGLSIDRTPS